MNDQNEPQQKFIARYADGDVPWDDELPPPEVIAEAERLTPARALDLGCGYGRTAIYLARQGWAVDGVDFVPQAIAGAARRAAAAGLSDRARFHTHSVTDLSFLDPGYTLAVDVGCMHALDESGQQAYLQEVHRLLQPGSRFLLFVRLAEDEPAEEPDDGPPRLTAATLYRLITKLFVIDEQQIGETDMGENAWKSGWFWLRRL